MPAARIDGGIPADGGEARRLPVPLAGLVHAPLSRRLAERASDTPGRRKPSGLGRNAVSMEAFVIKYSAIAIVFACLAVPAVAAPAADLGQATATLAAIGKDDARRKTYCEMQDLLVKAEEASVKKDDAASKALSAQAEAKSDALGADFKASVAIEEIDAASTDGKAYFQALEALEKSCPKA
jgi:hypothetical protein